MKKTCAPLPGLVVVPRPGKDGGYYTIENARGNSVALVHGGPNAEALANKMAAAPELMAACMAMKDARTNDDFEIACAQAEIAIAKAEAGS